MCGTEQFNEVCSLPNIVCRRNFSTEIRKSGSNPTLRWDGAHFFALIEEPLGQEKQADWCPDLHKREVVGHAPASATDSATVPVRGVGLSSNYETNSWPQAPFLLSPPSYWRCYT
jgi:hypothetical protein